VLDESDRLLAQRSNPGSLPLQGKSVALVFEKSSTRTRVSLEVGVAELGGHPVVVTSSSSQMGRGEPLADTARVLSRMVHAVTFRTADESRLFELMEHSSVPVLNALTDQGHPMQLLADLMTVRRVKKTLEGLSYVWIGDGNNMANSWIEAAGLLGFSLKVACPKGYEPDEKILAKAREFGARVEVTNSPERAVKDADVVSTDVFASMGQEDEQAQRLEAFRGFCVDRKLIAHAKSDVMVLHCLPAHRGEEIEAEVLEGPNSHVWDEAEARLHTAKAVLLWALRDHE
jgi:ornithine carbamoyltransferase